MNHRNKIFTALIVLFLPATSMNALADSNDPYESMLKKCLATKGDNVSSMDYVECNGEVDNVVKKDMNKFYDIAYKKISENSADDAKKFEQSQKIWLQYRELHCNIKGSYIGSPMYTYCPMHLNKERVSELRELAEES